MYWSLALNEEKSWLLGSVNALCLFPSVLWCW